VPQNFGYTATMFSLGGVVSMVMMFAVDRQPKYLIVAGAVLITASMDDMINVSLPARCSRSCCPATWGLASL